MLTPDVVESAPWAKWKTFPTPGKVTKGKYSLRNKVGSWHSSPLIKQCLEKSICIQQEWNILH